MTPDEYRIYEKWRDYIRERAKGYHLFGRLIDPDNPDHVILAAYFQGIVDASVAESPIREALGIFLENNVVE